MATTAIRADSSSDLYSKSINFAKRYVKPSTVDIIENLILLQTGTLLGALTSNESTFSLNLEIPSWKDLVTTGAFLAISLGSLMAFNKHIKSPFIQREIKQVIESSKDNPKSALIFRTSSDWNGSFTSHTELSRFQKFAKNHSIEILSGSSKSDIQEKMKANRKKYNKICIKGHANQHSITLAPRTELTKNSKKLLQWINDHIVDGGIISLESCSAAKGEDNIARQISLACPQATVYASKSDIHAISGIKYDEDGVPSFNNGSLCKGKNSTRIYRNGNLVIC